MVSAVILVNTDLDAQDNVLENLKLVDGVEEAHALYGVYDFFVKINASSIEDVKNITRFKIKQVSGVTSSLTLLIDDRTASIRNNLDFAVPQVPSLPSY
jgi:DNA-binding Lrp family transcriptional regulator